MLAVDTNVLVRVLVDDAAAPGQCRNARLAVSASAGHELATFDRKLGKLPGTRLVSR
ncbi:MAG: hypothetical protein Q8O25_07525 [Sulfurisoma sp.]|nr:hypothetical protein [Sulfurisoma sp.]